MCLGYQLIIHVHDIWLTVVVIYLISYLIYILNLITITKINIYRRRNKIP